MAYKRISPIAIIEGGTNATSMATSTGIVKYDGTRLVTSSTAVIDSSNRTTNTSQPGFFAYQNASTTNNTGDGTSYQVIFNSTTFDQNSNYNTGTGVFTAPVTGKYLFNFNILGQNLIVASTVVLQIVTTSTTYTYGNTSGTVAAGNSPYTYTVFANMSASDTAHCIFLVSGGTKSVGVYGGAGDPRTAFCGYLVC